LMQTDQTTDLSPQVEEGITNLKWIEPNRALKMVGYKNLEKVIEAFLNKQ